MLEATETDLSTQQPEQLNGVQLTQFLTVKLGKEEYGLDILQVKEIRCWVPVSEIPNTPPYEKGLINIRGDIVPVIDLRERFGLPSSVDHNRDVVVLLQAQKLSQRRIVGVVVDAVADVVSVSHEAMQTTPAFASNVNTDFIRSLVNVDQRMINCIDIDRLLDWGNEL